MATIWASSTGSNHRRFGAYWSGFVVLAIAIGPAAGGQQRDTPVPQAPELVLQTGHMGRVHALAFSPNGRWLASGSEDHLICVWDIASGHIARRLAAHTGTVRTVVFSPNGKLLGSGSDDGTSVVWDLGSGRALRRFVAPKGSVDTVAFSPDSRSFAAGSGWGTALWEIDTGRMLEALTIEASRGHLLAHSPDGQSLAFLDRGTKQLSFWNLASRKVTRQLSIDFAGSDDDWAATVVNHLVASGNLDSRQVADVKNGKLIPASTSGPSGRYAPPIAVSPDGRVAAGRDPVNGGSTTVWEIATGRQLQTLRDTTGLVALVFSPDGRSLAAANYESITVWSVESGAALWKRGRSVEQSARLLFYEGQRPHALSLIVGSYEGSIQIWDSGSGRPRRTIHDDIYRLSRFQRGIGGVPLIGVAGTDKSGLTFIDADSGMTLRTAPLGVFPCDLWTLSSDGNLLAHVSRIEAKPDQLAIIVSEFTTGRELRTFVSRSEGLGHLTFSRDNRWLLFSSRRSSALWDLTSGETTAIPAVREVDLSPDGQWLASYSDTPPTRITLMNLLTGAKRTVQASSPMGSIGFSPSGRYLTAGHDGPIFVWEVETGRRVFRARIDVATGWKSFCPDERCILTGSTTKPLQLWDIATGREMIPDLSRLMRGETHSFSPDMRWLATTASDGSVEIWDLAARTLAASLYVLNDGKSWLVRTPSGFFDVSDDVAKTLITWNVENQLYPADRFWRQRHRPGLLAAIFAGRENAIASTEGSR